MPRSKNSVEAIGEWWQTSTDASYVSPPLRLEPPESRTMHGCMGEQTDESLYSSPPADSLPSDPHWIWKGLETQECPQKENMIISIIAWVRISGAIRRSRMYQFYLILQEMQVCKVHIAHKFRREIKTSVPLESRERTKDRRNATRLAPCRDGIPNQLQ